nr:hypothetical protein CFP56_73121 [Quercus suber]
MVRLALGELKRRKKPRVILVVSRSSLPYIKRMPRPTYGFPFSPFSFALLREIESSRKEMGKFKSFVDTLEGLFWFRRAYGIHDNVGVSYCPDSEVDVVKGEGKVVMPLVAILLVAYLILNYTLVYWSFQNAGKAIKTRDPRLPYIDVRVKGYVLSPIEIAWKTEGRVRSQSPPPFTLESFGIIVAIPAA